MAPFDFAVVPRLETERLVLRRITEDDFRDWMTVWQSPGVLDYLVEFDGMPDDELGREILDWADRIFAEQSGIRWAITLKPDARLIGSCGFHVYVSSQRRAEIGYELHSDFWRRGIMTEAVGAVLKFCFETLEAHRVEADVTEGNAASAALLRKAGFTLEGVWRERVYGRNRYHSMWQFGMLAPEYQARREARNT